MNTALHEREVNKPTLEESPFSRWGLLGGLHYLFWYVYHRCRFWFLFRRINKRKRSRARVKREGIDEVYRASKRH